MTIYIIRHGQSIVNVERRLTCRDLSGDLTTLGYNQAYRAGVWLKDKGVKRMVVSPFERTRQTADLIGKEIGLSYTLDNDLQEIHCGSLEGQSTRDGWGQWLQIYQRWMSAEWDAGYPDGETFQQAYDRLLRCLMTISQDNIPTVLVTHGGITRAVLPYLCVNAAALQRVEMMAHGGMVVLSPYDVGRFVCESWNITEHLEGL
ncbi:MAG: histidine phosphatase family protein [bacterium]|nr:histidine phosphatase family protein [bacterium]